MAEQAAMPGLCTAGSADPGAHESLVSREMLGEVPLTGLSVLSLAVIETGLPVIDVCGGVGSTDRAAVESWCPQDLRPMNPVVSSPDVVTIPADLLADFEAAARRPLRQRMRYAFIHTHKPVLDDADFRAFDTTADYRRWCETNLPDWLGYGSVRLPAG